MIPKNEVGRARIYNNAFKDRVKEDVVMWDVLPILNRKRVKVVFESVSSPWRQGVWLRTDKGLIVNGLHSKSVELWTDTAPKEVDCECFTSDGFLSIYNIWDSLRGYGTESQARSSGMLVEELPNGRRYRCNDIGFETNFDKLIFRIERIAD